MGHKKWADIRRQKMGDYPTHKNRPSKVCVECGEPIPEHSQEALDFHAWLHQRGTDNLAVDKKE